MMNTGANNYLPLDNELIKSEELCGVSESDSSMCLLEIKQEVHEAAQSKQTVPMIVIIDDSEQLTAQRLQADVGNKTDNRLINHTSKADLNYLGASVGTRADPTTTATKRCLGNFREGCIAANNKEKSTLLNSKTESKSYPRPRCHTAESQRNRKIHEQTKSRNFTKSDTLRRQVPGQEKTTKKHKMSYLERRSQSHPELLNLMAEEPERGSNLSNGTLDSNGFFLRKHNLQQDNFHHSTRSFPFTEQETRKFHDGDVSSLESSKLGEEDVFFVGNKIEETDGGIWNTRPTEFKLRDQFYSFFQASDNKLAMKLFGSRNALLKEKRRQMEAKTWIIHPCSNFR